MAHRQENGIVSSTIALVKAFCWANKTFLKNRENCAVNTASYFIKFDVRRARDKDCRKRSQSEFCELNLENKHVECKN